jgi:hypothetical protein
MHIQQNTRTHTHLRSALPGSQRSSQYTYPLLGWTKGEVRDSLRRVRLDLLSSPLSSLEERLGMFSFCLELTLI